MTSLEEARQRVIDAARVWSEDITSPSPKYLRHASVALMEAVDALDALEQPDPWELLRELHSTFPLGYPHDIHIRVEAALAWRDAHPDQETR